MRANLFRATLTLFVSLAIAASAFAQAGMMKGKVFDAQGNPVEGAKIDIVSNDADAKKASTATDKKGEFIQVGLKSATYKVTASKDKVGTEIKMTSVRQGGTGAYLEFRLAPAAAGGMDNKKFAAVQAAFAAANTAASAGDHDGAIAKYNEALTAMPDCKDCYVNIGYEQSAKRDFAAALVAFDKAIALDANMGDAYVGKGIVLFNTQKFADAKVALDLAVKANPQSALAQYQLGMTNLNLGKIPEAVAALEAYMVIEPNGDKANEVKASLPALKSMVK